MAKARLDTLDRTEQKTNLWVKEIMELGDWDDPDTAYIALRSVLHTLRDRLTPREAVRLAGELPLFVCGLFFEGWSPSGKPIKMDLKAVFDRIERDFPQDIDIDPQKVVRTVFKVMAKRILEGEMADVRSIIPEDLRDLWPGGEEPVRRTACSHRGVPGGGPEAKRTHSSDTEKIGGEMTRAGGACDVSKKAS